MISPLARYRGCLLGLAAGDAVGTTLEKIFAAAHCLRHEEGPSKRPPATLEIGISPLATVGSIVVDKGDPEVRISYIDPAGDEIPTTSTTYKDSRFELAGGDGTVEALKIVDPLPGTWKVKGMKSLLPPDFSSSSARCFATACSGVNSRRSG